MTENDGYLRLINAVIVRAANDYRRSLIKLEKPIPDRGKKREKALQARKEAQWEKEDTERFFRSAWFLQLTNIDPEQLIKRLKAGVI